MGWVPGPQGEGATAGDRQRSASWALPLACQLRSRPRSRVRSLCSGQSNCRRRTTRARGECTALGLQGRGAQSGPQGIALTAPPVPLFVSPRKPQGKRVAGVGGKAETPGLDAGARDRKRGAWTPLASPSPSPGHTASFATSVLFPRTPRRGGRCRGCEPLALCPHQSVTRVRTDLMPPSPRLSP